MKTLKIKKIEKDSGTFAITFDTTREIEKGEFDLSQLGADIAFVSTWCDMIMVTGDVTLKAGDSITDDFGGEPIFGSVRQDAVEKDFGAACRPLVDYRDAFFEKHNGGKH